MIDDDYRTKQNKSQLAVHEDQLTERSKFTYPMRQQLRDQAYMVQHYKVKRQSEKKKQPLNVQNIQIFDEPSLPSLPSSKYQAPLMFENQIKKGVRWSFKKDEHMRPGQLSTSNKGSHDRLMQSTDYLGESKGLTEMMKINENSNSPRSRVTIWPIENQGMPFKVKVKKSPERFKFSKETMKQFNIKPDDLIDKNRVALAPPTQVDFVHNNRKIAQNYNIVKQIQYFSKIMNNTKNQESARLTNEQQEIEKIYSLKDKHQKWEKFRENREVIVNDYIEIKKRSLCLTELSVILFTNQAIKFVNSSFHNYR